MVRKARKKKGGGTGTIMQQLGEGASQWKQGAIAAKRKTEEGWGQTKAGMAEFDSGRKIETTRRQMIAGEYSPMAKDLLSKNIPKKSSSSFQVQKQREARESGESTAYSNPNPDLSPLKRKRVVIGGKRRKTRRKSRKRKTKRKKRRKRRKTKGRRKSRR